MKFDQDILFEFLPEEDKKFFQVWDSVKKFWPMLYVNRLKNVESIVATYRAPFQERIIITLDEYEKKIKQKNRDINIDKILNYDN
jgi:hypothetical protein